MLVGLLHLLQGFFLFGFVTGNSAFRQPLKPEEEKEYLDRLIHGTEPQKKEARNILIERNLRLVAFTAKPFVNQSNEIDDLISIGTFGLMKAIAGYDPSKKIKLSTFATKCIHNEILMELRRQKRTALDVSIYETVGSDREGNEVQLIDKLADDSAGIEERVDRKLQAEELYHVVNRVLKGRMKDIIVLRYGLNNEEPLTQREIAQLFKISRSYVARLETKGMDILRDAMVY